MKRRTPVELALSLIGLGLAFGAAPLDMHVLFLVGVITFALSMRLLLDEDGETS